MTLARRAGNALLWRSVGLAVEKVVFLVRIFVLARLVDPADFGLVAIGMLSLALMDSLTNFGIVPALVQQPANDKRHLDTAWTLALTRGLIINATIFVVAPFIASAFHQPDATNIIRTLALASLLRAAASIEIATVTRELKFERLVMIRLAAAVSNTIVSILLADSLGAWAIVWGAVTGGAVYLFVSYIIAPYRPRLRLQGRATARLMEFGRWIFAISVIGAATDAAIRWIVTDRFDIAALGLFFMATRLAYLPHQLITELVCEVAFPLYAKVRGNAEKTAYAFRAVLISTFAMLVPVCAIFVVVIPTLVSEVLGDRWAGAATVMQLLVLVSMAGSIGDTIVPLLMGIGRPKQVAVLELLQLVVLCPVAWVLVDRYGLAGAGLALLASVLISQILAIRYVMKLVDKPFLGIGGSSLAIGGATLAGTAISLLIIQVLSGLPALVLAGLVGPVTIALTILYLDRVFRLGLVSRIAEPFPILARFMPNAATD